MMKKYYKKEYDEWKKRTEREINLKRGLYKKRIKELIKFLKKNKKEINNGNVLDIGCGLGEVIDILKEYGFNAEGVELNDFARKKVASRGIKVYEDIKLVKNKYDLIVLFEVLEHIENTTEFLQKIKKLLKPDGVFVLSVPNVNSLTFRMLGDKQVSFHKNHLHYFDKRSLKFELKTNGFKIMKSYTERFKIFEFLKFFRKRKTSYKSKKYNNLKKSNMNKLYYNTIYPVLNWGTRTTGLGEKLVVYCEKRGEADARG